MRKKISILGSTGSIGVNTLEVISSVPNRFEVIGLACGTQVEVLKKQIKAFQPKMVSVGTEALVRSLQQEFPCLEVLWGEEGLMTIAQDSRSDFIVSALVGARGIRPTLAAIQSKKNVALANKEVLVAAGAIVMAEVQRQGVHLLPIDSEHSALFQVFEAHNKSAIEKVILTASGGPFLHRPKETFSSITPEKALKHPSWSMGKRITIDSATLMNKGFEIIEAHWLFNLSPSQIEVVVHPQSIVHSLISYQDGNMLACLSTPDMKAPISYALSYPGRMSTEVVRLNLAKVKELTFLEPDIEKFPLLKLAEEVAKRGNVYPALMNAADEVAVDAFLKRQISFIQISQLVEETLSSYTESFPLSLEGILEADQWARKKEHDLIKKLS